MGITERQEKILNNLIQEYIRTAKPVGSEFLVEKHNFKVCPATIRNEMQRLTDLGYLEQPHTSAGRIPTNKGYRFFVDNLSDFNEDLFFDELSEIETEDIFKFAELVTKTLASASSGLALAYLFEKDFLWKDGWKEVFQNNDEFKNPDFLEDFMGAVEDIEKEIKEFASQNKKSTEVFIGREKSLLKSQDVSLIVSKCRFPKDEDGVLAILGPSRMPYDRNINLMESLVNFLESF